MSEEKLDTEIRREQIAQAALQIVAAQGAARLSIAAVARRVGLVPSGIYRHFASKEQMLAAVLDLLEKRLMDNLRASEAETPAPLERLRALLVRHARFIREGRALPQIIFSDDVHRGHPRRRIRVQEIITRYLAGIARNVRDGQQQGSIRDDLDPATVALMFIGMVLPAGLLWHLTDGAFDARGHAERAWQMFRRSIAPPEDHVHTPSRG